MLGAGALGASVAVPASIAASAPISAQAAAVSAAAPIEIGTLPGGTDSQAYGINNSGEVVGWSAAPIDATHQAVHAFSWTSSGGLVDLHAKVTLGGAASVASAISDTGQIVGLGVTSSGHPHGYSWTQSGGVIDLGTLPGGSESEATGVSASGQVVGWADTTAPQPGQTSGIMRAFTWTKAGGMTNLGTFGGSSSTALGVSSNGIVVGSSDRSAGNSRAFWWTPIGGMVDLGSLGGLTSVAYAISDNGQNMAGQSTTDKGARLAFYWIKAYKMINIGTLGGASSGAGGVNDLGEVVGSSLTADGSTYGFWWSQKTGIGELPPLPGDVGSAAVAVNDSGQAVGWSRDAAGHTHAVLWRLPALPSAVRISRLRLTPASFRARRRGPAIASKGKTGAKLRFHLSASALVTFKLRRAVPGRQEGGNCLSDTPARRKLRRCTRYTPLRGSFKHAGDAGSNSFWFTGVFRNAPLKPGKYRLIATARAAGGLASTPIGFNFTIKA